MTFQEALKWLYATQQFGIKLGLENIKSLLSLLGSPETSMKFLHIAGTNGKGSVCAFLDSILRAEGYRTGLFTSPHLVKFQERICIQGEPISPDEVAEGLTVLKRLVRQVDGTLTFFELTAALAIWHFSRQKVDVVVWETGLGGRWDATNVVTPLVSVITAISYDHREWLGDTLAKIAGEKAGIFKPGVPAVSAPQSEEAAGELIREADLKSVSLQFVEKPCQNFQLGLLGPHQKWNAAVAIKALRKSGLAVTPQALRKGLATTRWPGRFQIIASRLVLDGAHNLEAAHSLVATWREIFNDQQAHVIFGSLQEKASEDVLLILAGIAKEFSFVSLKNPRSRPANTHQAPFKIPSQYFENSRVAVNAALKSDGLVLVTGSLFLVGEVLAQVRGIPYRKSEQ